MGGFYMCMFIHILGQNGEFFKGKLWTAIFYLLKKEIYILRRLFRCYFVGFVVHQSVNETKVWQPKKSNYFSLVPASILSSILPPTWMTQEITIKTSKEKFHVVIQTALINSLWQIKTTEQVHRSSIYCLEVSLTLKAIFSKWADEQAPGKLILFRKLKISGTSESSSKESVRENPGHLCSVAICLR